MSEITLTAFIIALFLALKAIEYQADPRGIYAVCSIGAWVSIVVGIVLLVVT